MGSQQFHQSQDKDLKELPQYLGEHETKSKVKVLPYTREKPDRGKDKRNISSLL